MVTGNLFILLALIIPLPNGEWGFCKKPGNPLQDGVVSFEAPPFLSRASTEIEIDVTISAQGKVEEIQWSSVEFPKVVRIYEEAVKQWRFVPDPGNSSRNARLTFIKSVFPVKESEKQLCYRNPLTVVLGHLVPEILRLENPEEIPTCRVHKEQMFLKIVPLIYVLPDWSAKKMGRLQRAASKSFPHAKHHVLGGCLVGQTKKAEVFACQSCLSAEKNWYKSHPSWAKKREVPKCCQPGWED